MKIFKPGINIFLLLVILSTAVNCFAQSDEPINTDRPDQSDGVYILPKSKLQVENGITIADETLLNNFMLRYGITGSTETRVLLDAGKSEDKNGLLPVTFSIKQRIIKQDKVIPAITFAGYVGFERLSSKDFYGKGVPVELKLAFEHELSEKFSLGYNVGTSDWFKNLNLTCGISYSPVNRFSTFLEYFSTFENSISAHNIDAGILFMVKPNLQLDIAGGRSLFNTRKRMFLTMGISYRFDRL